MIKSNRITFALTISLVAGAAALTGCAHKQYPGYSTVRANPTPELQSTAQRPIDIDRQMAVTDNHNIRGITDDLMRAFHMDHPSRLSPYPIMYTSGTPR